MKTAFMFVALGAALILSLAPMPAGAQQPCRFVLGFEALRNAVGAQKVGACLEDEHFNLANGNAEQRTSGGLLVWRKVDNFTAFTDGGTSWINGPSGLQSRPNTDRFAWEKDPVQTAAAPAPAQAAAPPQPATPPPPATALPRPPAPTVAPAPAAATASANSFGSGTKVVGADIRAGTYRSNNPGGGCYWARLKGLGGATGDIIANDNATGPAVVTILPGDVGFTSSRCADWVEVTGAITTSPTAPFGDGTWIVGVDIAPGLWKTDGSERCYWERASTLGGGGVGSIIANDNTRGSVAVQIAASDKAFKTSRCGTWTKAG